MNARSAACLCLLLGACRLVNYGSNLPDGGECPAIDGGGSATLTGSEAFAVGSATESQLAYQSAYFDGGRIAGWYDAGSPFIRIALLGPVVPCPFDGGGCAEEIVADLGAPSDAGWDGIYPLCDGVSPLLGCDAGSAFLWGAAVDPGGSNWVRFVATSGEVQVGSTLACSLGGTFSAWLAALVPDAGTDAGFYWADAGTLSGTFDAVYAP